MQEYIREGETYPRGYGFAWYEDIYPVAVCFLFPFNHIFAAIRKLWFKIRHVDFDKKQVEAIAAIMKREKRFRADREGLIAHCYNAGFKHGKLHAQVMKDWDSPYQKSFMQLSVSDPLDVIPIHISDEEKICENRSRYPI